MINAIIKGIFNLVISLVNVLLTPIDLLIENALPAVADGLDMVGNLFSYIANIVPWAISWLGFNSTVITLFVGYMTFKLTVPIAIHTVKLAIKWYDKIKP